MSEPKHISTGLEKGLKKFQEFASRMAKQAPPESVDFGYQIAGCEKIIYEYREAIER